MQLKSAQPIALPSASPQLSTANSLSNSNQPQSSASIVKPAQEAVSIPQELGKKTTETTNPKAGVTLGSIKDIKEAARQRLMAQQGTKEKIEITNEKLQEAWRELIEIVAKGKALYKSAIEASDLQFNAQEIIVHANVVALDFLRNERNTLLDFFKQKFCNEDINVLFELLPEKPSESGSKVLSSKEIYEKMAQKNPLLANLRATLGLDIEY